MTVKRTAFVVAVLTTCFGLQVAFATPPAGQIGREELATGVARDPISINTKGETNVIFQHVTVAPGAHTGWHTHSGDELTVIKSGTITLQRATYCTPVQLTAGDVLFVPGGTSHYARNEGAEPVELYTTYLIRAGQMVRNDVPDACQAP